MKNQIIFKKVRYALGLVLLFGAMSCSEDMIDVNNQLKDENLAVQNDTKSTILNSRPAALNELPLVGGGAYTVTLESVVNNNDGTFTWTWSVFNPNPGSGKDDGTAQNLSHWNITLGTCVTFDDVRSGAMSTDGNTYTPFTPSWEQDPSMWNTCAVATGNVLKFNAGTMGSAKSYCQLTITKDVEIDTDVMAYYKSGANTPCGTFYFPGFGCERVVVDEGCSMSQGFYFASKNSVWTTVTVGNKTYTKAEGLSIWNSSNKGGISDAKKGFLQVAAIKLSGSTVLSTASVWADVTIVENYLATLPKLTSSNVKNYNYSAAGEAAGRIGDWINAHHCIE